MSTRGRIGMLNQDGSVDSIYCHHDSYLRHVGKLLIENYSNADTIHELLKLGDTNALSETLEETKHNTYQYNGEDPEDTSSIHSMTESDFLSIGEEYNYIFKDGKWHVYSYDFSDEEVTPELIEQDS